jgi:amino acid transporter
MASVLASDVRNTLQLIIIIIIIIIMIIIIIYYNII